VEALARENGSDTLLRLMLAGELDVLRKAAAARLSAPAFLEQAALRSTDRQVLSIILSKLEDNAMMRRIAAAAAEPAMRLAAAQKCGAQSWTEIFDAATAKSANTQMLGNALAAVSLFGPTQEDARTGVHQACLNLIRRGDESRIPEMADLLEAYGDKTLAEDYLNCGQPDLNAAGRKWAEGRGYSVDTGHGSHRATWASDR